jgi:hypothetical protein
MFFARRKELFVMASVHEVQIDYTNWKGERAKRRIIPKQFWFGSNEWHPEPQWLLDAYDTEKEVSRTFAMNGIHGWFPFIPGPLPDGSHSVPSIWVEPNERG